MALNNKPSLMDRLLHRTSSSEIDLRDPADDNDVSIDNILPPLSPVEFKGYNKGTKNKLMTQELSNHIRNLLPPRLQLFDEWVLLYSMDQHGISLNTLYSKCRPSNQISEHQKRKTLEKGYGQLVVNQMISPDGFHLERQKTKRPVGYVMVIKDSHNNKFGCYLNEHLRPMDHKRYYGNGECFLWKLEKVTKDQIHHDTSTNSEHQRFKAFMYTGINDNIIYSNHESISIGSSKGQNGLWINSNLEEGVSFRCETFGNEVLNGNGEFGDNLESYGIETDAAKFGRFKILGLEIWRVGNLE